MRKVCSWCGREIQAGDPPTSHGICPPCQDLYFPEPDTRDVFQKLGDAFDGQSFADDFERVHGHAGQGARRIY